VREARGFLEELLRERVSWEDSSDLVLALSELATNAVRHAETPFEVVVETDGYVRIEVEDSSTQPPIPRPTSAHAVGGRGLQIVAQLCDRWGVHIVREQKCVWCERDLTEGEFASDGERA
jgi:anti-sigma regulatory factor (Ser/Thr protein kinase)